MVKTVFFCFIHKMFSSSLFASKVAVGTILLGISCEYVCNSRKESTGGTMSIKEQVSNDSNSIGDTQVSEAPSTNNTTTTTTTTTAATAAAPTTTTTTTFLVQSLEKSHTRSISLVHLNELVNQLRASEPTDLPSIEGGDELNETSFRDADDNYHCLINDQNCPPTPNFSKASTPSNLNETNVNSNSSSALTTITNKDDGIVFNVPPSTTNTTADKKKPDLNDVERFKMCGNSIIA